MTALPRAIKRRTIPAIGIAAVVLAGSAVVAEAGTPYGARNHGDRAGGVYRYVIAESAGRRVRAPVRRARYGDQVLVPKHGWAYCEVNCSFTVRKYYLEFWDYQTNHYIGVNRLHWDFYLD